MALGTRAAAVCSLVVAGILAAAPGARGSDWPRFRGPNSDGISPEAGINKEWGKRPPRVLWQVSMRDRGYAGPSVAQGVVYIVDHEGAKDIVRALALKNGSPKWATPCDDTDREVYGYARATPTVDGNRVYVTSRLGVLRCLDARTGRQLWFCDTIAQFGGKRPMWDVAASPVVDGGRVIVFPGGSNAAIAALDKVTGKAVWRGGGSETPGYATPVISTVDGRRQYLTMDAAGAVGYSTQDGTRLWHYPWPARDGTNVASPIPVSGGVFITSAYGMGSALLDVNGGQASPRWKGDALAAHVNTPVLYRGSLYGTSDPTGDLVCMDPATGRVSWRQPGFEKGGLVALDGVLLVVDGARGDVVMVRANAERYEELGRIRPLGGQSWSPPVVADGKLLIRNKSTLACLDLR